MLEQIQENLSRVHGMLQPEVLAAASIDEKVDSRTSQAGALIINADDWGRNRENTDRILDCSQRGTISSVSAMVFMEDSERAAGIAVERSIDAGLHLNLTTPFSQPSVPERLKKEQARLCRYLSWHRFAHLVFHPGLAKSFAYVVSAQLEEFRKLYGFPATRIDGHHHAHLCANVVYAKLLPEGTIVRRNFSFGRGEKSLANRTYRAWVDKQLARRHQLTDYFFALEPLNSNRLQHIFSHARNSVVEIETHPVNAAECAFLRSHEILRTCDGITISPRFITQQSVKQIESQEQNHTDARVSVQLQRYPERKHSGQVRAATRPNLVVVGFAEAAAAAEVVWSLIDAGFEVIAFARKGRDCALRHSRHVKCFDICAPEADLNAAISDLRSLLERCGKEPSSVRQVLFPMDDKAVLLCNRVGTSDEWIVAGPEASSAELALNKDVQIQSAMLAGFKVPKAILANTASDVRNFAQNESFPIILKSAHCVPIAHGKAHSTHNWICADRAELEAALEKWNEREALLVQRFVSGTGEGVFGLATENGVRAWSAHRRLRMMNPQGSGSSACISQAVSDDIRTTAEKFIRQTGWRGMFMIELLRDRAGNLYFIEFNGRPWGSMALSRSQKLEYPAWQVTLALDPESEAGVGSTSTPGIVSRNIGRELMHLLFVLRGPGSQALGEWPSLWRSMADVIRLRRGETFYNWNPQDTRVFFADVFYTLKSNLLKSKN